MTHLGPRLSALIDGELGSDERDRALIHVMRCGTCRDEAAALRTLKRRMNALGEADAGAGLTNRLMGLSTSAPDRGPVPAESMWPPPPPPPAWREADSAAREQRAARFFIAGSLAIFLAGLGTAAVIAGGEPQAQAPPPPVAPSVDVLLVPHNPVNGPATEVRLQHGRNVRSSR